MNHTRIGRKSYLLRHYQIAGAFYNHQETCNTYFRYYVRVCTYLVSKSCRYLIGTSNYLIGILSLFLSQVSVDYGARVLMVIFQHNDISYLIQEHFFFFIELIRCIILFCNSLIDVLHILQYPGRYIGDTQIEWHITDKSKSFDINKYFFYIFFANTYLLIFAKKQKQLSNMEK